jgi:hypothetical protein
MSKILLILSKENDSWIIAKIVDRIGREFRLLGHIVEVSSDYKTGYDYIFWSLFRQVPTNRIPESLTSEFFLITHVDDSKKLDICRKLIQNGLNPICMSRDSATNISSILGLIDRIPWVTLGSDLAVEHPPRMKILMSSILYPDGRKNAHWLAEGLPAYILDNVEFHFLGRGWDPIVQQIENQGGIAKFEQNDSLDKETYEVSLRKFQMSDLVIYTGFDEGSLSVLDAYLLGLDLLVSAQGFHLEFGMSDQNLFTTRAEFYEKFQEKLTNYIQIKSKFTWSSTAMSLIEIFKNQQSTTAKPRDFRNIMSREKFSKARGRLIWKRFVRAYRHALHLILR